MKNINAIDILNQCIDQIANMTDEEYNKIKKERGIINKEYDIQEYINNEVEIILPNIDVKSDIIHKEILDCKIHVDYDTEDISMKRDYGLDDYSEEAFYSPIAA